MRLLKRVLGQKDRTCYLSPNYTNYSLMYYLNFFLLLTVLLFAACLDPQQSNESETATTEQSQAAKTDSAFGGLALYTLRDTLAQDPKGVLQAVADMGYRYIEAAGYADGKFYGMEPQAFKAYLDQIGLIPMSSHHGDVTLGNADEMIAAAKAAGFTYFVIPIPPMGHFHYDAATQTMGMSNEVEEVMDIINTIAAKCHAAGIQCLYHNHNFEFNVNEAGIVPMHYFIEESNPEHLSFQMDLYWVTQAGADPLDYFAKAPGRFVSWHVKDMDDQGRFAPVGTGHIDFGRILEQAEQAGLKHYFVEQDMTFNHPPLEAIAISHEALEEIGFE